MADAARLAEIDRELDSFDKNDDVVRDVVARAVADAPTGLEAVDAVLEGIGADIPYESRAASTPTRDEQPASVATESVPIESLVPEGMKARPAEFDEEVFPVQIPAEASGLVEVPEQVIRATEMPAVLALDPSSAEISAPDLDAQVDAAVMDDAIEVELPAQRFSDGDLSVENTDIRRADQLTDSDLFGDAAMVDASGGGTLDDLFDDVPASRPDGIGSIFEEDEPTGEGALMDLDASLDLSVPDEPEHTMLFSAAEIQAIRSSGPPPPKAPPQERALDAQLDALVSEPMNDVVEPDELPPSGEFELLVDEDVLVIDDADVVSDSELIMPQSPSAAPPPVPTSASTAPPGDDGEDGEKKGFFSRILNRK